METDKKFSYVLFSVFFLISGCSSFSSVRFKDQPIVWKVDDEKKIPEPEKIEVTMVEYHGGGFFTRRLTRFLELRDIEPAHNTNALDEIPDSSWFTNRIGIGKISPDDAAWGANVKGSPKLPLTVVKGKSDGRDGGFFAKDATGRLFLVKFDSKSNPEMRTATSAMVSRFFWTAGYHVPAENVFYFCRKDVQLDPIATIKNDLNEMVAFGAKDLEDVFERADSFKKNCYRAFGSEILKGESKGGFPAEGIRKDDPNDLIPHEHRRELRALRVFSAWVGHNDMTQGNTLDMYVEENGKRFLKHHLIDFSDALAAYQVSSKRLEMGWEHYWDWEYQPLAALALGLWKRPWEDQKETRWKALGTFSADGFDPERWRGGFPYWPYTEMDAADAYWIAKIIMKFDRKFLEAIVAKGELSDSAASSYLVETLLKRRDKIGRTYFEAVTPLDDFSIRNGQICATDLSLHYEFVKEGSLERLGKTHQISPKGEVCFPMKKEKGYQVDRLKIRRGEEEKPEMQIHYISDERPRIVGLIRTAE